MKKCFLAAVLAAALLSGCSGEHPPVHGGITFTSHTDKGSSSEEVPSSPKNDLTNVTVELTRDPKFSRTMRIRDGVLIFSGYLGDLKRVSTDIRTDIDLEKSGSTFTCTITAPKAGQGYLTVYLEHGTYQTHSYRIRFANGKFSLPDVGAIAENNLALAEGDIPDNSAAVTLQNITMNGKSDNAAAVLNEVKELSDKICSGLSDNYDKLRAISRWVSANIYYDHIAFNSGIPSSCLSLEYILKYRRSVCGGYANMTSALAQAQGILCYNVYGEGFAGGTLYSEANGGDKHEWNYAYIGGRGIWLDSGWNSHNHYTGEYSEGDISTRYFDISNDMLAMDHKANRLCNRDFFNPDLLN